PCSCWPAARFATRTSRRNSVFGMPRTFSLGSAPNPLPFIKASSSRKRTMKLYTFEIHGRHRLGAEWKGQMIDLETARDAMIRARGLPPEPHTAPFSDMLSFLRAGEMALAAAGEALAFMAKRPALFVGEQAFYLFGEIKLLAPIPRPGKILCSG